MPASIDSEVFEFPCSLAQQRLWIDDRLAPGNPVYNIHASICLPYALDEGALRRALQALVLRHESLRTTFIERDGRPLQRVAATGHAALHAHDLRALAPAEREARVRDLAQAEAIQPFDLRQGPLLRVQLLHTGAAASVLLLTIHHIVADAWSMGVLLRELTALYTEALGGTAAALPELPIQYADYAVWQQGADAAGHDTALAYWLDRLDGLPTLALPTDRPRPAMASHRGRMLPIALDSAASSAVQGFAQQHALTPYVVLLAALAVVLQRNAGQDEVVVGVPVNGRDRPELEGLIGFFVNTLVLRLDLSGQPSFRVLALRVQRALHDALAHQELPFERLVQLLCRERDLSRNPLFQVSAQYLATSTPVAGDAAGGGASVLEVQRGAVNFDLGFDFWPEGAQFAGRVDYASDLFDAGTVERWVGQWRRVLAQALAAPEHAIDALDLLSPDERALLLGAWAGQAVPYPHTSNLALEWQRVVHARPDTPALRWRGGAWTVAALDAQAARYAVLLAESGLRPGHSVGIALPRGPEQIAALLGALRLGAAYVALDPAWPAQRLALCRQAAGLALALCEAADAPALAAAGLAALVRDRLPPGPAMPPPLPAIAPLAPAYVAFTSGSTGVPKAVQVPQRAVLRLVCGNPDVPLHEGDRMLVYAPLAFDASTLEIWGPLLQGGCLSIAPPGPLGLDELARWIDEERISVAWLTAGLFHQMADVHAPVLARIERLFAGGDVLSADAVRRVLALGGGRMTVLNGYGPTENTTFTCVHAMRDAAEAVAPVPIGRPIANGFVRVVDAAGTLVPVGIAGELLAGGDGLALGYLGDDSLNATRFIDDPAGGGRVYRTGDRVRWRADGRLEFLGRVDRQFKVRGYRIEAGEVEAALRALPGVADAHVLACADRSGDKHLVAHVAPIGTASPAELRHLLGERLPAWMLPTALHLHAVLPLNANGKIDEAALLAMPAATTEAVQWVGDAAPDTDGGDIEALVAQVWAEVLGQPVTNPRAGFFAELGGHSLLATQAVARLNAALGIELPLSAIFEQPTVRGLAARLETLLLADLETGP